METRTASELSGLPRCELTATELSDLYEKKFEILVHGRLRHRNAFQRVRDAFAMIFNIDLRHKRPHDARRARRFDVHGDTSLIVELRRVQPKSEASLKGAV